MSTPATHAVNLHELIRKRHSGPGWALFEELANSTGHNVKRFADVVALGIWPTHRYAMHCYEVKISRNDLKKELEDPSKADEVGKCADYFWLVARDEKVFETLVVPEHWGILVPAGIVLRPVKKAQKQKAKPWTRDFCAAVIRNINDRHVPKHVHDEIKESVEKELRARIERQVSMEQDRIKNSYEELLREVSAFQEKSGINIRAPWTMYGVAEKLRLLQQLDGDALTKQGFELAAERHERTAAAIRELLSLPSGQHGTLKGKNA